MDQDLHSKVKALVVHREPDGQKELDSALVRLGCEVVAAPNARAAARLLETDPDIDVLFADMQLPQDQGPELLKATRLNPRLQRIPVIMTCEDCDVSTVTSCLNQAATAVLKLPTDDGTLRDKLEQALATGKPMVLVVDDEDVIRDILASLLRLERFRVVTAANGREALAALEERRVDAVVSDILMPSMNGLDLLVAIKEQHHDIPVILITGHSGKYKPADLIAAGADGYFTKPFKNTELTAALRAVLKNSSRKMLPTPKSEPVPKTK